MSKARNLVRVGLAGLLLFVLSACTATYRNHGYAPTKDDLSQIQIGKDTRDTVRQKVGAPSSAGLANPAAWYYVQSRRKYLGARAPQEVSREVVAIGFTKTGHVENIGRFGLKDGNVVPLSRRVTTPNVKGIGFLRQLLGNVGNFDAKKFLK